MKNSIWLVLFLVLIAVVLMAAGKKGKQKRDTATEKEQQNSGERLHEPEEMQRDLRAKRPLTAREETMFFRMREAFPQHIVLAQVAFSALLDTRQRSTRGTFSQKVTDFVLCDLRLNVLAIIELDDSSHRNREEQDAKREALLTDVGYRVMRYERIPEIEKLRDDFNPIMLAPAGRGSSECRTAPQQGHRRDEHASRSRRAG